METVTRQTRLPAHHREALEASGSGRIRSRLLAGVVFSACTGLLLLAAWLSPDHAGHGTHTQLGLPPCSMVTFTGIPCATCGMTTTFALAADGRLVEAAANQPAGAMLAILVACGSWVSLWAMVRGVSLMPLLAGLWTGKTLFYGGLLAIVAWLYKIFITIGA